MVDQARRGLRFRLASGGAGMVLAAAVGLAGGAGLAAEGAETEMSPAATKLERSQEELDRDYFRPDPTYEDKAYDAESQIEIYGGKREVVGPRPLLEIGRPQYTEGPFQPGVAVSRTGIPRSEEEKFRYQKFRRTKHRETSPIRKAGS